MSIVRRWLERHPRWTFHFTPTSASWLNAVEGFFATLTKRRLKRGVFRSLADLQAAINRFLEEHNQQSKPFTWTVWSELQGSEAPSIDFGLGPHGRLGDAVVGGYESVDVGGWQIVGTNLQLP